MGGKANWIWKKHMSSKPVYHAMCKNEACIHTEMALFLLKHRVGNNHDVQQQGIPESHQGHSFNRTKIRKLEISSDKKQSPRCSKWGRKAEQCLWYVIICIKQSCIYKHEIPLEGPTGNLPVWAWGTNWWSRIKVGDREALIAANPLTP